MYSILNLHVSCLLFTSSFKIKQWVNAFFVTREMHNTAKPYPPCDIIDRSYRNFIRFHITSCDIVLISSNRGVDLRALKSTLVVLLFLSLGSGLSCSTEPEWPEGLPHGELILPNVEDPDTPGAYFDFSAGELVYGEEGRQRGDIYLEKTFISGNPALGVQLAEKQPDSILYDSTAPSWGSGLWRTPPDATTPARVAIRQGYNVWVKTSEGNFGKLKILLLEATDDYTSIRNIKMQWIFQPDPNSDELAPTSFTQGAQGTSGSG